MGLVKCDIGKCPEFTRYSNITNTCQACQLDIGGHAGLNCESCTVNGVGKCDEIGCPPPGITQYNNSTHMCEEAKNHKQCN